MPKILIIDDDEQDRKIMARVMKKAGFSEVVFADSGAEGIVVSHRESPALVITDTVLPDVDGFSVCRMIKAERSSTRVIVTTGKIDAIDAGKAKDAGAEDYIVKSTGFESLAESVGRLLGGAPSKDAGRGGKGSPTNEVAILKAKINDMEWANSKTNAGIKSLYKTLERSNMELAKLNEMKSYFVSIVSHDFRSPVSIMHIAASNLLEGKDEGAGLSPSQKEWVKMILRNSTRLNDMVSRILDVSTIEAQSSAMKWAQSGMEPLITEIVTDMQLLTTEKRLTLEAQILGGFPELWMDKARIQQVLVNLINNAIKFTGEGGKITVSAKHVDQNIQVMVADNGPGIEKRVQETIFGRFEQLETSQLKAGVGLGLAICKDYVSRHSGRIWVESELGRGSRFIFELPLDPRSMSN